MFEAAKIRSLQPILNLVKTVNEGKILSIAYHRDCRSRFTLKRDLDSLEQKADGRIEGEEDDETGLSRAKKRVTPNIPRIYKQECIFCEKDNMLDPLTLEKNW